MTHIILTHEQADFDALASLLGASLLYEQAVPVLPRRMNRNLRAFLALYGEELPFIDPRDLPSEPIDRVTLVDTQSIVSVKGMSAETQVQVIDHHPRREGLPENWLVISDECGATATLLVEILREHNGALTPIQATLMMLGIYEDTGSLTYTRTTVRDLRAAAYLLEQGASLRIIADFLNQPLSRAQQDLYDDLRRRAETLHIHGHTVVVACGDALEMDEELSSVAHKLRDLLDPDGLFVLVNTRAGVQMIARSTSDHIDVAAILAFFGGGGHERAAAGLVRDQTLDAVHQRLVSLLPGLVRPAVTVAQIMSRDPQLLTPETTVEEAAQRMRRFGYEGFPVVKDGKVVGLLTRRSVDRAISHKLNLPVLRLMDAGEISVSPDDSVEHLHRVVSETGWGQIPVVEPESGKIIGIVTRTDLLKTLAAPAGISQQLNLSDRLESSLPEDRLRLLRMIAQVATEQHSALYIVGGFVRDLLLESPSPDFDLVVEGDAISLAQALAKRYGGRVTSHARFGTAKWHLESAPGRELSPQLTATGLHTVDLITARTEFYSYPTALPTVERGSIKLDLHRRDFTINTLALRLDGRHYGELHDYWGGLNDLRSGLVRVLHSLSFVDDPTRILRAVRFEQRFGFKIEDRTMDLLMEARPLISRLSGERIRHELNAILTSDQASQILKRMHQLGLLTAIHPYLDWDAWLAARFESLNELRLEAEWEIARRDERTLKRELGYILWLMRLRVDQALDVAARLKMPVDLVRNIQGACGLWAHADELQLEAPGAVVACLEDIPPLARYAFYLATENVQQRQAVRQYVMHWRRIMPTIDGHALRKLGLPPGPNYRTILDALRLAWLEGKVHSSEDEQALLNQLIRQYSK